MSEQAVTFPGGATARVVYVVQEHWPSRDAWIDASTPTANATEAKDTRARFAAVDPLTTYRVIKRTTTEEVLP